MSTLKKTDEMQDTFLNLKLHTIVHVPIIVVYYNPLDYPNKYVARLWDINSKPTRFVMVKNDIGTIRGNIPAGMVKFLRSVNDDPAIVETWL